MAAKLFINYRRDDERAFAARIHDRLAGTFGRSDVFMDVDNLMAGQRFDRELDKALAETDLLLAIIGPRWLQLLHERVKIGDRDYVREEIAAALARGIAVIPVLVERSELPRGDALPDDIRALVMHHAHVVGHEQFGHDMAGLTEAIRFIREPAEEKTQPRVHWFRLFAVGGGAASLLAAAWAGAHFAGAPVAFWGQTSGTNASKASSSPVKQLDLRATEAKRIADLEVRTREQEAARAQSEIEAKRQEATAAEAKRKLEEDRKAADEAKRIADLEVQVRQQEAARAKSEIEAKRQEEIAAQAKRQQEEVRKAEEQDKRYPALRVFRDRLTDGRPCPACPEMVVMPAGSFLMGSPDRERGRESHEGPQRKVSIARPFAIGRFEVTFANWDACVALGGCRYRPETDWGRGKQPVHSVSWNDITIEYLPWLSRRTGVTYRLPTEAEWEYAARAGTTTRFHVGDWITRGQAQWSEGTLGSAGMPVVVGSFPGNAWGLHDVHGNVREWVQDCYGNGYHGAMTDGSARTERTCSSRVLRGGAWSAHPLDVRSAARHSRAPDARTPHIGFRVARTIAD